MKRALPALVAEAIGVFALSLIGILAIYQFRDSSAGLIGVALAHGLILSIMISAFGSTSGGHFNPAVTIAFLVSGRIKPGMAMGYIAAQVIGGLLAGVIVLSMYGNADGAKIVANGTPNFESAAPKDTPSVTPGEQIAKPVPPHIGVPGAVIAELVATFFLMTAIWGTAVDPRAPKIGGFGIGLTVAADILAIGPLTGAAMNPARAFGPALAAKIGGADINWSTHWIYWVAPAAGAILASIIYTGLIYPKAEKPE